MFMKSTRYAVKDFDWPNWNVSGQISLFHFEKNLMYQVIRIDVAPHVKKLKIIFQRTSESYKQFLQNKIYIWRYIKENEF